MAGRLANRHESGCVVSSVRPRNDCHSSEEWQIGATLSSSSVRTEVTQSTSSSSSLPPWLALSRPPPPPCLPILGFRRLLRRRCAAEERDDALFIRERSDQLARALRAVTNDSFQRGGGGGIGGGERVRPLLLLFLHRNLEKCGSANGIRSLSTAL